MSKFKKFKVFWDFGNFEFFDVWHKDEGIRGMFWFGMNILNQMHFKSVCISKYQFSVDSKTKTKLTTPDNRTFICISCRKLAAFFNILRNSSLHVFETYDEFKYAVVSELVQSCLKCAYFVSRFSMRMPLVSARPWFRGCYDELGSR